MPGLLVPIPTLSPLLPRKGAQPDETYFLVETPLAVRSPAVSRVGGAVVGLAEIKRAECRLCRRMTAAAAVEAWDAAAQTWRPETSPEGWTPMAFDAAAAIHWRGVIASMPSWKTSTAGFPAYFARTRFETRVGPLTGNAESAAISLYSLAKTPRPTFRISPTIESPSSDGRFALIDAADAELGALVIGPNAGGAPRVSLEVRDTPNGTVVGRVRLSGGSAGGTVELTNAVDASVVLQPDGGIVIKSAPGKTVVVNGALFP